MTIEGAQVGGSRSAIAAPQPAARLQKTSSHVGLFSRDAKIEALKRVPLFQGLSRKQLTELAKVTEDVDPGGGQGLVPRAGTISHAPQR